MKKFLNKFKVIIIGTMVFLILLFLLIGILLLFNNHKSKKYENETYSIVYDSSWKLKEKKKNYLLLKHKKSKIEVSIKTLEEAVRYNSIRYFKEEVKQMIQNQNPTYKFLKQSEEEVTKRNLEGYKFLYESKGKQGYVVLSKYNDKLFVITYEANSKEFDLLLDSVTTFVSNFEIKDDAISLNKKIREIKTTGITYSTTQENFNDKKKKHTIGSYELEVTYEASEKLVDKRLDTTSNYYNYKKEEKGKNKEATITTDITPKNLYEKIEEMNSTIDSYKKSEHYKGLKKENDKITNNKIDGYIYKIRYYYDYKHFDTGKVEKIYKEKFYVLYGIDPTRTFVLEIEADDALISKKDIESFKIIKKEKVGAHINRVIKDNKIVNTMKTFYDGTTFSDHPKYIEITLHTPTEYVENPYGGFGQNLYDTRRFGSLYNEEKEEYKYKATYTITSKMDKAIQYKKENLKDYKNVVFKYVKDIKVNNQTYKYYQASYNLKNSKVKNNEAYLFTSLEDGQTLCLAISTKDDIISMDRIEGLLDINFETKEYKN